jgi:ABC-type multidrug transport system fused ATPase/permease subunit
LAGIRLPLPVRATRPGPVGRISMILAWIASMAAFLVCLVIYARQYVQAYGLNATAPPTDRIAPITLVAVAVVFVIIISRRSPSWGTRLASGAIGALAAPWIFELPFDLVVMARTYPPIPPDPALYRALFFVPLSLIAITTLLLLRLSPMVRLTRATFFSFALMLGVFAVWALSGFGYPSAPLPTALNIASKILAFVTALTLFLPQRPAPGQAPQPDSNEQAQPASPPLALDSPALTEIADDPQLTGQPAGSIIDEQAKPVPLSHGHHPSPAAVPQLAKVKEADMSEPAVVVRGLCKSFGAKEAVAGVDLEIAAGSLAGLVGPNGAGKTTSLSMMTGLLRPDVGQILINGLVVSQPKPTQTQNQQSSGVAVQSCRIAARTSASGT